MTDPTPGSTGPGSTGPGSATPDGAAAGDLRCERIRLLLSLSVDGASTPAQDAEIDVHVAACAECVDAAVIDRAVRARIGEPATVPEGFAPRVAALAARQRMVARSQNRFVLTAGAAAVAAAGLALLIVGPSRALGPAVMPKPGGMPKPAVMPKPGGTDGLTSATGGVRASAGHALSAHLARGRLNRIEER